jgi:mannan endo-1,4-beta-mannosidase
MRFTKPNWIPGGSHANRLLGPIIALSLVTIAVAVYLSPAGPRGTSAAAAATIHPKNSSSSSSSASARESFPTSSSSTTSAKPTASPTPTHTPTPTRDSSHVSAPTKEQILHSTTKVTVTAGTDSPLYCYQFKYQQDAQAAYLANLSDPWGLDGAAGPSNGDGLACSGKPNDPGRPISTAVDAFTPPPASPGEKSTLTRPALDYWGVTKDGLPNDTGQLTTIANQLAKAPSSIGYFSTWDKPFNASQVVTSWRSGALPVMTWQSKSSVSDSDTSYSFTNILAGNWDTYLYKYAGDIVRTNLPIVIRFDHEMNGNWYPWSAGVPSWNNTPARYIAVWQHVWNIFQAVGANDDVIWDWSPARVDTLTGSSQFTSLAADYPGDAYVDWVGATVYWRHSNVATDYTTSFGRTISQLRAITNKPMFFAEVGAIQTDGTVDQTANKQAWMRNTLAGFLANPSIVGFLWFDNTATTPDDPLNPHDWHFDSSAGTLAEFKTDVADARFSSGIMPDA